VAGELFQQLAPVCARHPGESGVDAGRPGGPGDGRLAGPHHVIDAPEWYAGRYWTVHLHVAALIGFVLAMAISLSIRAVIDHAAELSLQAQTRALQVAQAGKTCPDCSRWRRRALRARHGRVFLDGFGALEFQTPGSRRLKPRARELTRAKQGAKRPVSAGLELERCAAVRAIRARVEKGVDLLLEEVPLQVLRSCLDSARVNPRCSMR